MEVVASTLIICLLEYYVMTVKKSSLLNMDDIR